MKKKNIKEIEGFLILFAQILSFFINQNFFPFLEKWLILFSFL